MPRTWLRHPQWLDRFLPERATGKMRVACESSWGVPCPSVCLHTFSRGFAARTYNAGIHCDAPNVDIQLPSDNMHEHQTVHLTEDERKFISAVRDSLLDADARLADDPALLAKLTEAHSEAKAIGLTRDASLANFTYLQIQAPEFHRHRAIRRWLGKPGTAPDERFADLVDVLRNKSRQLKENE